MSDGFVLSRAFELTSTAVTDLDLCAVRLHHDARFPWLVLIPRLPDLREVEDLKPRYRMRLLDEAVRAGVAVRAVGEASGFAVEKLNLGALGNLTPQLHLHVVGRREGDACWPGPVWGQGTPRAYRPEALARAVEAARASLGEG